MRFRHALGVTVAIGMISNWSVDVAAIENFRTNLSGSEEVPSRDTRARGQAIFQLKSGPGGDALQFRLNIANIQNVVAAHIHVGASGTNGPVVAFLFGPVPPALGRFRGVLAAGAITDADLVGPLEDEPLEALMEEIRAGNTYVNVHTNDGVEPDNTGPGDFPGGEIRGQID